MSKNTILVFMLVGFVVILFIATKTGLPIIKSDAKSEAKNTSALAQKPILDRNIDINDVVTDPAVYSNLTLTLEGKINDWVTKNSFTFTPTKSTFGNSGKALPVINRNNYKLPEETSESDLALGEIANIKVTGKVVIFDRATLEKEWKIDLNDKMVDKWNKTPVILVDKIEKI